MEEPPQGMDVDLDVKTAESTPQKRTIVLGVVNTSGMKSSNASRKRRWDQAPDEIDPSPASKMACVAGLDEETSQVPTVTVNSVCDSDSNEIVTVGKDTEVSEVDVHQPVVTNEENNDKIDPKTKFSQGTVEKSFISDSLKRIQFSYDEGDSNSSDGSNENSSPQDNNDLVPINDSKTEHAPSLKLTITEGKLNLDLKGQKSPVSTDVVDKALDVVLDEVICDNLENKVDEKGVNNSKALTNDSALRSVADTEINHVTNDSDQERSKETLNLSKQNVDSSAENAEKLKETPKLDKQNLDNLAENVDKSVVTQGETETQINTNSIDPAVMEVIFGSKDKQIIMESEDVSENDDKKSEYKPMDEEYENDSTEIVTIDPTEPLSEDLSEEVAKPSDTLPSTEQNTLEKSIADKVNTEENLIEKTADEEMKHDDLATTNNEKSLLNSPPTAVSEIDTYAESIDQEYIVEDKLSEETKEKEEENLNADSKVSMIEVIEEEKTVDTNYEVEETELKVHETELSKQALEEEEKPHQDVQELTKEEIENNKQEEPKVIREESPSGLLINDMEVEEVFESPDENEENKEKIETVKSTAICVQEESKSYAPVLEENEEELLEENLDDSADVIKAEITETNEDNMIHTKDPVVETSVITEEQEEENIVKETEDVQEKEYDILKKKDKIESENSLTELEVEKMKKPEEIEKQEIKNKSSDVQLTLENTILESEQIKQENILEEEKEEGDVQGKTVPEVQEQEIYEEKETLVQEQEQLKSETEITLKDDNLSSEEKNSEVEKITSKEELAQEQTITPVNEHSSNSTNINEAKSASLDRSNVINEPALLSVAPLGMNTNLNTKENEAPQQPVQIKTETLDKIEKMDVSEVSDVQNTDKRMDGDEVKIEAPPFRVKTDEVPMEVSDEDEHGMDKEFVPLLKTVSSRNSAPRGRKISMPDRSVQRPIGTLPPMTIKIDDIGKSPLVVDCKSPPIQKLSRSSISPQTKQLEFTLKIAKDANTNIPKATMSPKSGMTTSPNSVWKLENQLTESPKMERKLADIAEAKKEPPSENRFQDLIKQMLETKPEPISIPEVPPVKVPKKRGRPRKVIPPPSETPPSGDLAGTFSTPEDPDESNRPMRSCRDRTKPTFVRTRKPRGGGMIRGGGRRGRGGGLKKNLPTDRESLSEHEKAELAKIEARKEKIRMDQIAKYKAKKEKKLAKKLKDEERRKRIAREKAEKAEAAAPQVFEEETRMSAPETGGSRGHTPAPHRMTLGGEPGDESQSSLFSTPLSSVNKKGRMEIPIDYEHFSKEVTVNQLAEYQWQGSELYMIQEQVSLYLGVKSFKRKYPDMKRRPVEAEERTYLEDSGLVPKSMCDLGLTAVSSAEVLDVMFQDFPDKYEEFRKYVREKQAREASSKQRALAMARRDGSKIEPREQALEAVANWNANLNRERNEERKCALDLQTFTVHYPQKERENMTRPVKKVGLYPLAVIPGQYCDYYKEYTPTELMYFPLNTVLYGPLKPNEKQSEDNSETGSDSDDSSSSDDTSSSESDSSDEDEDIKCKLCNGTKKNNKNSQSESLIQCANCKKHVHPTCLDITPEMLPHIEKYQWVCPQCKKCVSCKESVNPEKLMSCDLCNRGYHVYCVGLRKIPEGRWHCTICSYCTSCNTRDPGGSDWQHEFKKSEKGAKIYQRTLCTPCFKLWRKGKYCQICFKCYGWKPEEDSGLRQCNTCERWIHKECFNIRFGVQNKTNTGFQCDICQERIQSSLSSHGIPRPLIKV
ncbi:uncharacterized protein LOC106661073 isoform X2 [Cimex lectularius]|uniref:PHD-type domain-containing protein n=1 Tax=Cimex lectularius TaxID=79782 RepID=A0A8I6R680_CIMLE|nr:uncharacterized protein LOC106661073 isoform X2 [Cimex lectularius]